MWTADDVVDSVFLIYLKYIDNSGFCIRFRCSSTLFIQWGTSVHGWVSFPIMFNSYRVIITNHQGTAFYDSKPQESGTLGGFTLDVGDNSEISMDAYWIAIGL